MPFKCKNEDPAALQRTCFNRYGKPCDFTGRNVTNCKRYDHRYRADRPTPKKGE